MPTTVPASVSEPRPTALATPKSATLTRSSLSRSRFAGLTSRWTIPLACAASSAAAAWREPLERAPDRLRAVAGEPIGERAAGEVLHHDVRVAVVLADVEDRHRARRVREARGGERLAREARSDRFVVGVAVGEHLDRDDAREVGVLGAVDLAHAAVGDPLGVPVPRWQTAVVHGGPTARAAPGSETPWRLEGSVKKPGNREVFR